MNKMSSVSLALVEDEARALLGKKILIVVSNNPTDDPIAVGGFAWARIQAVDTTPGSETILAVLDTDDLPAACGPSL